jgi:hypothetical protein
MAIARWNSSAAVFGHARFCGEKMASIDVVYFSSKYLLIKQTRSAAAYFRKVPIIMRAFAACRTLRVKIMATKLAGSRFKC